MDNNKSNNNTDMTPLLLSIEAQFILAIPTKYINTLVPSYSLVRDTSFGAPALPPITELIHSCNPPPKVTIAIIVIEVKVSNMT